MAQIYREAAFESDTRSPDDSRTQPWREWWPQSQKTIVTSNSISTTNPETQPWLIWRFDPENPYEKPWSKWPMKWPPGYSHIFFHPSIADMNTDWFQTTHRQHRLLFMNPDSSRAKLRSRDLLKSLAPICTAPTHCCSFSHRSKSAMTRSHMFPRYRLQRTQKALKSISRVAMRRS